MSSKFYKNCVVTLCVSTTVKTPNKLFIYVPHKPEIRKKWLQLARRDPQHLSTSGKLYFCEDHFDLPNDMVNYIEYQIMGHVSQILMKPGCVPSKFDCQPDRQKRTTSTDPPYIVKKQRMMTVQECLNESVAPEQIPQPSCSGMQSTLIDYASRANTDASIVEDMVVTYKTADKATQVLITRKIRSKAIQVSINSVNKAMSPIKSTTACVSTSPFKVDHCKKPSPGFSSSNVSRKLKIKEDLDSDVSFYAPPLTSSESSPSKHSIQTKSTSDCSEFQEYETKLELERTLQDTIKKIKSDPRFFIGIPRSCYFLIDLIMKELELPEHCVLLCLKKIRLDTKFKELGIDFGMTSSAASKIFLKNIPKIASVMHPFIVKLIPENLLRTLPMSFRHKYYNVGCIIDCLEIEIQKPSNAVHQALTWSEYKKANTLKYLISCTPNGLVGYISPGFGGRATDTCIVESCDFIKTLSSGMCVMADRGFKNVQKYLEQSGIQLVRPTSVQTGVKMTKKEANETKQIASLRIHVERVIRRLREFLMLKPHACINMNFVKIFDDIMIIACGLINIQDSLIK